MVIFMKKQNKFLLSFIVIAIILVIGIITVVKYVSGDENGLSILLYDQDKNLIKATRTTPTKTIISSGDITQEGVEYFKLRYKVTNTGEVPLTIKLSNGEWIWGDNCDVSSPCEMYCITGVTSEQSTLCSSLSSDVISAFGISGFSTPSQLVQAGSSYSFMTDFISVDNFDKLPKPTWFTMCAVGLHPDLEPSEYPYTCSNLFVTFTEEEIIADITSDFTIE